MNGYTEAKKVEAESWRRLEPFIAAEADGRMYVRTDKGPLAKVLQQSLGDVIFNPKSRLAGTPSGTASLELKAEKKESKNLFLEVFSNRNLDDLESHILRGSTLGWMYTSRATLLFYHFLDTDTLCMMDMFKLQRWAFGCGEDGPSLYALNEKGFECYPERKQGTHEQMNDTWGRCVPRDVLKNRLGQAYKEVRIPALRDVAA